MPPDWAEIVGWISLGFGFACALIIVVDELVVGHRQQMAIMNLVHPITRSTGDLFGYGAGDPTDDLRQFPSGPGSSEGLWSSTKPAAQRNRTTAGTPLGSSTAARRAGDGPLTSDRRRGA
jgi:hypothetical protein